MSAAGTSTSSGSSGGSRAGVDSGRSGSSPLASASSTSTPPITPSITPSRADTAKNLENGRGIKASYVADDRRFDHVDNAREVIRGHLLRLGCPSDRVDREEKDLVRPFRDAHACEDDFNEQVFAAMHRCFQNSTKWTAELYNPPPDPKNPTTEHKKQFLVLQSREEEVASDGDVERVAPAGGDESADEGGGTVVNSANVATDAAAEIACAREEEREEETGSLNYTVRKKAYALGLARGTNIPKMGGRLVEESTPDHALVIFSRDDNDDEDMGSRGTGRKDHPMGGWSVCQVLAAVELKRKDRSCGVFENNREMISLTKARGLGKPLAQEIAYVAGLVLWGRAALGMDLPASLPLAVVACEYETAEPSVPPSTGEGGAAEEGANRQPRSASSGSRPPRGPNKPSHGKRARWAYGGLVIPEIRGGAFSYNVSSTGAFQGTDPESALAVYLEVMMEGLEAGSKWIQCLRRSEREGLLTPERCPKAMSGRVLYFGDRSPMGLREEKLLATPASMVNTDLRSSQGEIFGGLVDLAALREATAADDKVFWFDPSQSSDSTLTTPLSGGLLCSASVGDNREASPRIDSDGKAATHPVVAKVTSKACNEMLVQPDYSFLWELFSFNFPANYCHLYQIFSRSLHAVYAVTEMTQTCGMVQLMPDLRASGYQPLHPKDLAKESSRKILCEAFGVFIKGTLVPLALENVVHADIRLTYSTTHNVLYNSDKCSLLMVDLDSLTMFLKLEHLPKDVRIVSPENGPYSKSISSALEFVCLQVICIATVWRDWIQRQQGGGSHRHHEGDSTTPNTEKIIQTHLHEKLGEDTFQDPTRRYYNVPKRKEYFSKRREDASSFVLREVEGLLAEFVAGGDIELNEGIQ